MNFRERHRIADLGIGVGARRKHYPVIFGERPSIDWFEIISENFLVDGGPPLANLERLTSAYRVVPHGVSLSIGSSGDLDEGYLRRLKALFARIRPPWASDHLCWTASGGVDVHDLMPLPYTEAVARHVAERLARVQDFLEVPFAIENASSYMTYRASAMPEWEFVSRVAELADCGILLDCNNVREREEPRVFARDVHRRDRAGPRRADPPRRSHRSGTYLLDTHSAPVAPGVWISIAGPSAACATSTLIEWDEDIPEFSVVVAEAERAARSVTRRWPSAPRASQPEAPR